MKDIQTLRTQFRVSDFVAWQRDKGLLLNPNFQRRNVWKKKAKSYLIDTIIRGLPMPIIFLRDLRSDLKSLKPKRDVVDGQQRIRTILSYVDSDLLDDFDPERDEFTIDKAHNLDLAGKSFEKLDRDSRQAILDYQFSVHSFAADTDDRDILQIFARMNATGLKLNDQELRNAGWFGQFKTLAYSLATEQLNRWRGWEIFTADQIARMYEVELVSEFMILIMNGVLAKRKQTLDSYYDAFDENFPDAKEVASRLRSTFDTLDSLLPRDVIAASFSTRTLFYPLFATLYGLQYEIRNPVALPQRAPLVKAKPEALPQGLAEHFKQAVDSIRNQTAPLDVLQASRGAVSDPGVRRKMIEFLAGDGRNPLPQLP
jgi:hypothetical protein